MLRDLPGRRLDVTRARSETHRAVTAKSGRCQVVAYYSRRCARFCTAALTIAFWILSMISELATSSDTRKTIICLDEFSAVGQGARASQFAAGLVERTRSAGIAIIIGAQTIAILGDAADRLRQTCGTVIAHRTPSPDGIVKLAGPVQVWEDSNLVDGLGLRVATSGRLQQQYRVPPDLLRSLPIGVVPWFRGRIIDDEKQMRTLFGSEYETYSAKVGRWGPFSLFDITNKARPTS